MQQLLLGDGHLWFYGNKKARSWRNDFALGTMAQRESSIPLGILLYKRSFSIMRSVFAILSSIALIIYSAFMRIVNFFTDSHAEHMEDYREEFEEYALTQERFLGCRFTRGADGKYLNDDLQKAWVNFHEARFQRDNAW
ncbi:hypothetical protein ACM70F_08235 [Pseudomonas aeruginosa]|nr:hypothetical protein [Pseudomonas phage vB_Pae_BR313c]